MRLGYIILYVKDVQATVSFYEAAFGLSRRFVHESGVYAEMETGATALAFVDETFTPPQGLFRPNRVADPAAGAEIGLIADIVQDAYSHAVTAGAVPVLEPARKPWGQTVAFVRDLNGVLVELCDEVTG